MAHRTTSHPASSPVQRAPDAGAASTSDVVPTMTSLLLLFWTILSTFGAPVDDELRPSPTPGPAALATDDELTADALLDRAARFQRGDEPRGVPAGLHGRFFVEVFNHEDNSKVSVEAERIYRRSPERMLTRTVVEGLAEGDMTVGFDGQRTWIQDHLNDDQVEIYDDRPEAFATDIELQAEQRRLTRLILDALLIDGLREQLRGARLVPGTDEIADLDGIKHEVAMVKGTIDDNLFGSGPVAPDALPPDPDAPSPELLLQLSIDVESGALWALRVRTVNRSPVISYELRFDFHQPNRQGLMLPANIRVFENGRDRPRVTFSVSDTDEPGVSELTLGGDYEDSVFAVPEAR